MFAIYIIRAISVQVYVFYGFAVSARYILLVD